MAHSSDAWSLDDLSDVSGRRLLAVLANPPLTAGDRTTSRVERLRAMLGFDQLEMANLFGLASHATGEISTLGRDAIGWVGARRTLDLALGRCDVVLLAYGVTEPGGAARAHHRAQVAWLCDEVRRRRLPTIQLGDGPRHPSRWQRYTSRHRPGTPFDVAVRESLRRALPET